MMSTGDAFISISSYLPTAVSIRTPTNRCDEYDHTFCIEEIRLMIA